MFTDIVKATDMMAKDEEKREQDVSSQKRLERIKRLILERDKDAAKIIKFWISNQEGKKNKRS